VKILQTGRFVDRLSSILSPHLLSWTPSQWCPSMEGIAGVFLGCNCVAGVNCQVKEQAGNTLVIIYQHVGERLRSDLVKKDIHPSKYITFLSFVVAVFIRDRLVLILCQLLLLVPSVV